MPQDLATDLDDDGFEMAQTYGTAPVSATDEPASPHGAGESSALLGGDRDTAVKRVLGKREGKASMVSSVSNLANTIIGSGESRVLSSSYEKLTLSLQGCSPSLWFVNIFTKLLLC